MNGFCIRQQKYTNKNKSPESVFLPVEIEITIYAGVVKDPTGRDRNFISLGYMHRPIVSRAFRVEPDRISDGIASTSFVAVTTETSEFSSVQNAAPVKFPFMSTICCWEKIKKIKEKSIKKR